MPGCLSYVVARDPTGCGRDLDHRGLGQQGEPRGVVAVAGGARSHQARPAADREFRRADHHRARRRPRARRSASLSLLPKVSALPAVPAVLRALRGCADCTTMNRPVNICTSTLAAFALDDALQLAQSRGLRGRRAARPWQLSRQPAGAAAPLRRDQAAGRSASARAVRLQHVLRRQRAGRDRGDDRHLLRAPA